MKIAFIFLVFHFSTFAQCDTSTAVDFPEVDAQFPGGMIEMKKFLIENFEYPDIRRYDCFAEMGRFYLEFIVCDDGTIQNVHLMRPSDSDLAQVAIDLIEKMPNWIPAKENGQPVSSRCRLPINIHPQ